MHGHGMDDPVPLERLNSSILEDIPASPARLCINSDDFARCAKQQEKAQMLQFGSR